MVLGKNIAHDMKSGAEGAHFFGALLLTFSFDKHTADEPKQKYNTISLCFPKEMAYRVFDEFEASDIKEMENGDLIITTEMPEDNWLIGYLLSFGTQVTVIEPIYLKKILADEAKKIYEKNKP